MKWVISEGLKEIAMRDKLGMECLGSLPGRKAFAGLTLCATDDQELIRQITWAFENGYGGSGLGRNTKRRCGVGLAKHGAIKIASPSQLSSLRDKL